MTSHVNEDHSAAWDAVAAAWATHADVVEAQAAPITEALLARLDVRSGDHLLELAAGPGSMGATWSRRVGPGGKVLLSDISPAMVAAAIHRNAGLVNVSCATLDASAVDRPDASFDVVVCRMGLMFVPDPHRALTEMRRVLRPGGRFAVLTWAGPEHNPWMTCVGAGMAAAGLVSVPPAAGVAGVFSLGEPAELEAMVGGAGFADVGVAPIPVMFRPESIDDHVRQICALAPPLAEVLRGAVPAAELAVRRATEALTLQYRADDGLALPGRAIIAWGRA